MKLRDGQLHLLEVEGKSRDAWVRTDGCLAIETSRNA
jgi:hypothetical protein